MLRPRILTLIFAFAAVLCVLSLREAESQSPLRRITNTTNEGININPSISGDGRILGFESTEDIAGAGGADHFRAIRANISIDPPGFFQIGATRAVTPAISQDGSRIAFASKDNPLGTNSDGNSEIFVFNGSNLVQITNTSPGDIANRVVNGNFQPSISDDGRYVAFSSNRDLVSQNSDGNLEIFVFDATANTFAQLTNSSATVGCSDAKISGDGAKVAFIRDNGATPSARRDLMIQNRASGPATVLASQVLTLLMTYGRAISDDGARVVYSGETAANSSQVFFFDGRSGNVNRQVTSLGTRITEVPLHPTISGDGKRLSFAARRAVTGFTNSDSSVELYTYDIPTTTFARVTNVTASEADCFDGSSLACEVVSSLNDDGSTVAFNFPRALSGAVTAGLENKSEIYATATVARPPSGTLTSILNQASHGHEPSPIKAVAPDSIAAAFGTALANSTLQSQRQPNGTFPTNVAGTTVTVNGRSAQIIFVSPGRVHFLVPAQTEIGTAEVVITNADGFESRGSVPILRTAPGIFTKSGDGVGEGMIINADSLQEGPFDPTGGNLRLLIFSTGVRNALVTTVNIGGRVVNAESVVASPDMQGLDEVRVVVPSDLRGTGTVNLSIQSDGRDSNPVTITFTGNPSRAVFINEVLADPPDGIAGDANRDGTRDGTQDEFVELVNGTATELINIGGWTVRTRATGSMTENTRFTFASGTSLPAGNAIVVFGGGNANFNPNDNAFGCAQVVKATTATGLSLTNGGLTVLIRDASGNLIAELPYGGSTGLEGDNNQSLTRSPDVTGAFVQHTAAAGANGRRFSPGLRVDGTPFGNCPSILTSVTIAPPSATITVGQTQQFTAQAFDQFGRVMTGVTISFTSDNTSVATVDSVSMNSTTGVATATVGSHNPGTAHITASATDGSNTVNSSQAVLTVEGPSLTINDVSLNEGDSGTTIFSFTVSLSTPAPVPVTFDIATQDNTATVANSDYVGRSLTGQTIPAGLQTYTFDVTVNGDGNLEPFETFFVNFTNISGASPGDPQGLGTIQDDDGPVLNVSDVTAEEGNTGTTIFTFTVTSTQPAPAPGITFDIATADGTAQDDNPASEDNDYVARTLTSQTIPAGQTSYTFQVTVNGDTAVEANENFTVNISNVSANATADDAQGIGTIQNDDFALMVISQIYGGGNNSGAPFKNDFVELFNRGTTTVDLAGWSVQQASATGTNWSVTELCPSGTCLVVPGKYFLVKLAPANPTIGADLPAPDATGTSNLSATSGKIALVNDSIELTGSGCPFGLSIVDFVGYGSSANCSENSTDAPAHSNTTADFRKSGGCIDTNDNAADFVTATPNPRNSSSPTNDCSTGFRPDITINNVSISEGDSGTKTVDFTVALSAVNNLQTVTVNFATADGSASSPSDYQSTSGQLTFNPGETSKPVTVTIVGDTTLESDETFFVNLSNPVNAVILDGQGQGTITEDEVAPTLSINDVSMTEGNSGTKIFQFTVNLSGPALSGGVTFDIATQDNSATVANGDYVAKSLTNQTIPAGQQTYTFNVTVNGDTSIEPNETFFVNVTNISGATAGDTQGTGTIQTDDSPVLSINDVSMTEGDTGTKIFTFTISSTMPAPAGGITFDITTQDGTAQDDNPASEDNDYVANSTIGKTIAAGTTSTTFDVIVNGDRLVEPDETFNVVISNASGGDATIGDSTGVGTIQNDDAALLVISQLYGGGNNVGATFQNDFVEIFNRGTTTVNFALTNYSVQYASASGSFTLGNTVELTSGTLIPGQYFLVKLAGGTTNGVALPPADATENVNLANDNGKVALVVGTTVATTTSGCPTGVTVSDLVGYGSANCSETAATAALSVTKSALRNNDGCTDTDNNAADFTTPTLSAGTPPRNSASPTNDCTSADLEITKIDSPDPVITGSNVTYTITVTNHGPATGNSVSVTDNLPANVTFVSCASTGAGICAGSGNNRTITFASLSAGASETITLVATANGPAGTPISNTATVSSSTTDPNAGNNSATATTDVNNPTFANLSIVKTDSPDPVSPTGTLTYTLSVTNNGPDTAQSVIVTDTLSSDVTFVDCLSDQGGVCAGTATSPTITFSSLANGITATITIHVTVNSNVTDGTVISNTASVTSATTDSTPGNNSDSEDTAVTELNAGELVISEFRTRGPSGASDEFVEIYNPTTATLVIGGLKIRASNGTGTISDRVTITAGTTLGPGCHYLIANSSASGYSGATTPNQTYTTGITDDGGIAITRANGTTIIDQVGMSAGSAYKEGTPLAQLTNNVEQSYERKPGGTFGNGTDTNDNSADFFLNPSSSNPQNSSSGCVNTSAADVSITKTDSPDPVVTGSNVTYTIMVTNNGPAVAQSVVVTDNLPADVTFVSCGSTGAGVCGGTGNNRTVTFASLAAGASETITLVATANGAAGTTITNTATVASTTTDSNSANNSATATTDVTNPAPPALSIGDVTQAETNAGTTTFTFTVSLSSPAQAGGVSFTVNTADGTTNPATAGSDYVAIVNGSGSIAENASSTTVDVTVNGDTVFEPNETFFVNITGVTGATVSDGQGLGTITNDDAQPTLAIADVAVTEGNAGTSLMTFTVTLTGTSQSTVTVDYATADSSATVANSDYDTASGTLNFVSGDTSETFTVTIHGDVNAEGDEMFLVNLSGASGATITDTQALGIIFLDDPFSIAAVNTAYPEDFNVLAPSGVSATTPAAWTRAESGTSANNTYTANDGQSNSGDTYSYGTGTTTERALGGLQTGTLVPTIGAFYRNDTGSTLNSLQISYTGEQWRLGTASRTDQLDFQYSTNATNLTTGTWIDVNALDFTTPNTTTAGAKDGNNAANRTAITNTITGLSIAPGATFWIRWTDFNASGADDGLAVDDFSITAGVDTPALSINDVTQVETNSGTTTFNFTVQLTSPAPPGGVSFTINTADGTTNPANAGSDYVAIVNGSGSIAQNGTSTTVSVTVNGDTDIEPDETFFVNLSAVSGATVTDGQGLGTITNDDAVAGSADLSITKTDSPDPVAIGNDITYTITVTNGGPNAAANAVLSDTVPTNTTFRSITAPVGWTCPTQPAVGGTGAISCNNASFSVGSAIFTLVVRVGTAVAAETVITNTASVSSTTADSNPGNESAMQTTTVKQPLLVISQVYGGGGNASATYTNDFIEIFNRGTTTVDFSITPYSVQYAAATSNFSTNKTDITSGILQPGRYFLIQQASGGAAGVALPTPDATGSIGMSATAGKVALVLGTTSLTGSGCPLGATIVDFLGYGSTANCSETAPISVSSTNANARSVIRTSSCTDTNNNSSDFTNPSTAPVARNTATTPVICP